MADQQGPALVDHILVEIRTGAGPDRLWKAIRDPATIYNWFGWEADTLQEEIDFIFCSDHVLADEAGRTLRFEGMPDRFEVEPCGEGGLLRIVRASPAGEVREGVYDDMVEGWISFVEQLRFAIERHGLGPRHTLYLSGDALAGGSGPIDALGLAPLRTAAPGSAFRVDLPTGESVEGEAWHRSPWQVGLTVPQWGDGLLIATDKSVLESAPDGRGMVILTTYGLSEADFAALETRWRGWWDAHFRPSTAPPCS